MGDGRVLALKWNNHLLHFKNTLNNFHQRELLNDATLVCYDNFYPVHKFVLACCSDYFSTIFEKTPCKHPFIILKGVLPRHLEILLNYMYEGEVNVAQSELTDLLQSAELLQIKGLAMPDDLFDSHDKYIKSPFMKDNYSSKGKADEDQESSFVEESPLANKCKLYDEESETFVSNEEMSTECFTDTLENEALPFIKEELNSPRTTDNTVIHDYQDTGVPHHNKIASLQDNKIEGLNSLLPMDVSSWSSSTFVTTSKQSSVLQHLQSNSSTKTGRHCSVLDHPIALQKSNINTVLHPCPMCPKKFQSHADVVRHFRTHTGERPYCCPHCDYKSALKGNLKTHILSRHSQLKILNGTMIAPT